MQTINSVCDFEFTHNETKGPRVGLKLSNIQVEKVLDFYNLGAFKPPLKYINKGYNNRSYMITTVDNHEYVLRLCGNIRPREKTENEVAAIIYISKTVQTIPVPNILGFCSNKDLSVINQEYILMEKLPGVPLDEIFENLELEDQIRVVENVTNILCEFQNLRFDQIGSFWFSENLSRTFGIGLNLQNVGVHQITIGPGLEAESGPFETYLEYFKNCCETELRYLRQNEFLYNDPNWGPELHAKLKSFIEWISKERSDHETALTIVPFAFVHGDLETRNLLINPSTLEITGIVDFEFSGSFPIDDNYFSGLEDFGANTSESVIFREIDSPTPEIGANEVLQKVSRLAQLKKACMDRMKEKRMMTPPEIPGHFKRALLYYFKCNICPWWMREPTTNMEIPKSWFEDRQKARNRIQFVFDEFGFK